MYPSGTHSLVDPNYASSRHKQVRWYQNHPSESAHSAEYGEHHHAAYVVDVGDDALCLHCSLGTTAPPIPQQPGALLRGTGAATYDLLLSNVGL